MRIPVLSYEDLKGFATDFLAKYHSTGVLPIPIESIIDPIMGLNIVCQQSLQHVCGVDAFVNCRCDTIYVDGEVYLSPNQNRYRFSLGHELSHILLHRHVIENMKFDTMGEWLEAHKRLSDEEHAWLEWQAHSLGGLLLVPPSPLKDHHEILLRSASTKWRDRGEEFIRSAVQQQLATIFQVSVDVIDRRCSKEGLAA